MALEEFCRSLTPADAERLYYDWQAWARSEQIQPPGDWDGWLVLAGRGYGKTRAGAEWVRHCVEREGARRIALIGQTAADVRMVMTEGESGVLACCPPDNRPDYQPSRRIMTWPNGAVATTYSGDSPDQLRGPEHDRVWADEPAKWRYPAETWSNMEMGLRVGDKPRWMATTTPRAIPLIRQLVADHRVVTVRGSTFDNAANLPPQFLDRIRQRYEGTRLGRQELYAEILDDVLGALWSRDLIERSRVPVGPEPYVRICVSIDPQGTKTGDDDEYSDRRPETGIVVSGLGADGHAYTLADLSGNHSPREWARCAVDAWREYEATWIVAERNFGGDMVEHTIRTVSPSVPIHLVTATRGKVRRAEPVVSLYEQGRVHHVGQFAEMEDEMCTWTNQPGERSPNRLDALVWGVWKLMLEHELGIADDKRKMSVAGDYDGYDPHATTPDYADADPGY